MDTLEPRERLVDIDRTPGGQTDQIVPGERRQTTGPKADGPFVYVVEQSDGEQKLLTPAEFRKLRPVSPERPTR